MPPKAKKVIIVGSGPSLRDISANEILNSGAVVMSVNGSIDWLGKADYWFTLDPSQVNMVRMRNQVEGCRYVMAVPNYFVKVSNVTRLFRVEGKLFGKARAPGGLSDDPSAINTGNSAFGALNLAYHMRPDKIVMLGVDGSQFRRVDGGMPRSLDHLPELFGTSLPQLSDAKIEVRNGSPDSSITCFERMKPREAIEWLQS